MKKRLGSGLWCAALAAILITACAIGAAADGRGVTDSGTCGDDLTWTLYDDGVLEITGTGAMPDYDDAGNKAPWRAYASQLKTLKLGEEITAVGAYAFNGCSGLAGELAIPDGVTAIGAHAFTGCSGFTGELALPDGVTSIGAHAFSGCSGFTGELALPDGVTSIAAYAFTGCSGFTGELAIPDGVTSGGQYAFSCCSGFTG